MSKERPYACPFHFTDFSKRYKSSPQMQTHFSVICSLSSDLNISNFKINRKFAATYIFFFFSWIDSDSYKQKWGFQMARFHD